MKINVENEKVKRQYIKYLKEASGFSDTTIYAVENAVFEYEDFARQESFGGFSQKKAIGYKKYLLKKTHNGKELSVKTVYHYLRHLKAFFIWLSSQPGYKSKVNRDSISYLSLDRKMVREARSQKPVKYPSLEYVLELTRSIDIKNDIDRRDKAMISFLLISGMRDQAVCTLPLGCLDCNTLEISQLPSRGVKTKFGKNILSTILRFHDELVQNVVQWAQYLKKERLYSDTDPLFPRSKTEQAGDGFSFICADVEPKFWKGTGSIRSILKARAQNAGLEYYYPHAFRHAAVHLALKKCKTIEQLKAVSQSLGHEKVFTTLMTYGALNDEEAKTVIESIEFTGKDDDAFDDSDLALAKEFVKIIKKRA